MRRTPFLKPGDRGRKNERERICLSLLDGVCSSTSVISAATVASGRLIVMVVAADIDRQLEMAESVRCCEDDGRDDVNGGVLQC